MTENRTESRSVLRLAGRTAALALVAASLSACVVPSPGYRPPPGWTPPGAGITPPAPSIQRRVFSEPRIGGRWLDVCYAHGACRDRLATATFCRQQGYQTAEAPIVRVAPFMHETVRIGDQSSCRNVAGNCHRVVRVTCARQV